MRVQAPGHWLISLADCLGLIEQETVGGIEGIAASGGEAAEEQGGKGDAENEKGDHHHQDAGKGGDGSKPAKVGNTQGERTRTMRLRETVNILPTLLRDQWVSFCQVCPDGFGKVGVVIEVRGEPFPKRGFKKKNGSHHKKAELKAGLPKLKAIDGEHHDGSGKEIVDDGRAAEEEKASQHDCAHEGSTHRRGAARPVMKA